MINTIQTVTSTSSSNSSTLTATWSGNTFIGDTIVIVISKTKTMTISSVTDSQSNVYTLGGTAQGIGGSGNVDLSLYYCVGIAGGTTPTITVNLGSTGNEIVLIAREFSGITGVDRYLTASGSGTAPSSGASSVTTNPYEIVIGFLGAAYFSGDTISIGSGYTNMTAANDGNFIQAAIEEKRINTNAAQTATFTITSENWACGVVTFIGARPSFTPTTLRPHAFSPGIAR